VIQQQPVNGGHIGCSRLAPLIVLARFGGIEQENAVRLQLHPQLLQRGMHRGGQIPVFVQAFQHIGSQRAEQIVTLLVGLNSVADFCFVTAGDRVAVVAGIGALTQILGLIQGTVSPLEQLLIAVAVVGHNGNTNGAGEVIVLQLAVIQALQGIGQHFAAALGQLRIGNVHHKDQEFITADSGEDILFTEQTADGACHTVQNGVTKQMTELVVDGLEVIQIDDQQSSPLVICGVCQIAVDSAAGGILVQETGEGVLLGFCQKRLRMTLIGVNVGDDADELAERTVFVALGRSTDAVPGIAAIAVEDTDNGFSKGKALTQQLDLFAEQPMSSGCTWATVGRFWKK